MLRKYKYLVFWRILLCSFWLLHLQFSGEILTAEFTFKAERITRRCANIPTDNELVTWRHYEFGTVYTGVMCMLKFLRFLLPSKITKWLQFSVLLKVDDIYRM